jgi:antitoxin VapB
MPLYIKDDSVDDLARRFMALTKAGTKSEAVRLALMQALEQHENAPTAVDIARQYRAELKAKAGCRGLPADKPFRDSLYGEN